MATKSRTLSGSMGKLKDAWIRPSSPWIPSTVSWGSRTTRDEKSCARPRFPSPEVRPAAIRTVSVWRDRLCPSGTRT